MAYLALDLVKAGRTGGTVTLQPLRTLFARTLTAIAALFGQGPLRAAAACWRGKQGGGQG